MSSAAEIETMIVRILGDATDFDKVMDESVKQIIQKVKQIENEANKAIASRNAVLAEGARITEAVATPTERFAEESKRLNSLLAQGAITGQTWNRAMAAARSTLPQVAAAQKAVAQATERHNADMARATSLVSSLMTPTEQYRKKLAELNSLYQRGYISSQTYARGVAALGREFATAQKYMSMAASQLRSVGGLMTSVGMRMTVGLTAPLTLLGSVAVREMAKFDKTMTESIAIMGKVSTETRGQMEAAAIAIAKITPNAPEEAARAFYFLAQAGYTAEQSIKQLPIVADYATASAQSMEKAVEQLSDAQSIMGLTSKDPIENMKQMARVADVVTEAANRSKASQEQFAKALATKSGSALRLVNKSLEEGTAILMAYAEVGIRGELAGEKLDIMLRELDRGVRTHGETWKKLGMDVYDASGAMRPVADIIGGLEKALGPMTDEQRQATLAQLGFRSQSKAAVQALFGQSQAIRDFEKGLQSAGGAVKRMSDEQLKSFSNQLKILQNQLIVVAMDIGKILAPAIMWVNDRIKEGIKWWESLSLTAKQVIVGIAAVLAVLGPLAVTFGTIVTVVAGFVALLASITTVGLAVAVGLASVAAQIVAFGAAIAYAVYQIVGAEGLMNIWETITAKVYSFVVAAVGFLMHLSQNIEILTTWLWENWFNLLTDLVSLWGISFASFYGYVAVALETAFRLFIAWQGWLVGLFKRLFSVEFLQAVWSGIKAAGELFVKFAQSAWEALKAAFSGGSFSMEDLAKQMGSDFDKGAANLNFLETAANIMGEQAGKLKNPLDTFTSSIAEGPKFNLTIPGQEMGQKLADGVVDGAKAVLDKAPLKEEVNKFVSELATEVEELTAKLKEQVLTYGMSSEEADIFKLATKGATDAQLAEARALSATIKALDEDKKLKEKAKQIIEKSLTPAEKFNEVQKELELMLKKGHLTAEQFQKAMADARKDLSKDIKIKVNMTGLDALEAGTLEAADRLAKYREMIYTGQFHAPDIGPAARVAPAPQPVAPNDQKPIPVEDVQGKGKGGDGEEKYETKVVDLLTIIARNTNPDKNTFAPANL